MYFRTSQRETGAAPLIARRPYVHRLKIALLLSCLSYALMAVAELAIPVELLGKIERKFGNAGKARVVQWQQLMTTGRTLSDQQKLERVNDFFNQAITFTEDILLWHVNDYWATPIEFLAQGAGDCEDYAIAKYFTLKELGVAEQKMRITYVKAIQLNQAHMVLTYFETPRSVPMVLDNLKPVILPATARNDLVPVYSFNGSGLWLAKARGAGQQVGGSERLSLWADLTQRMMRNAL
ncbi:MAG: sulfate adenylyltransferase [Methylococcaceae bacterium]|nr:sulfate adenylyltransferase [Methylococcaceae bacterium]